MAQASPDRHFDHGQMPQPAPSRPPLACGARSDQATLVAAAVRLCSAKYYVEGWSGSTQREETLFWASHVIRAGPSVRRVIKGSLSGANS